MSHVVVHLEVRNPSPEPDGAAGTAEIELSEDTLRVFTPQHVRAGIVALVLLLVKRVEGAGVEEILERVHDDVLRNLSLNRGPLRTGRRPEGPPR